MIAAKTVVMLTMLNLAACASTSDKEASMASRETLCVEPRPQVCTSDYRPVCASLRDGGTKTYANGCSACGDVGVVSWVENACAK